MNTKPLKRKRPKIGDVVEIETPIGFAYLQYTYKDPRDGELLRLLPGIYEMPLEDVSELAAQEERYFLFLPLAVALRQGRMRLVAHEEIPVSTQPRPFMRFRGGITRDGTVLNWWVESEEGKTLVSELRPEQYDMSIGGIWNTSLLILRIVEGWKPSDVR